MTRFVLPLLLAVTAVAQTPAYKPAGVIKIGGTGGWDYLAVDSVNRRLYVSHTSKVEVIDLDTQKPVGSVDGLMRVHGIAVAPPLGVGFISDGGANQVVQFGLKDLAKQKTMKTGSNPDGIVFDELSKRVFAFNGRSQDATVINAADGADAGTIKLSGKPEFPVSDGIGHVFVNIEDKNEIASINVKTLAVDAHWPLTPCESPSGLAFDKAHSRLFSVCDGKVMAISDAKAGKLVTTVAIGDGPDAAAYDPATHMAFSSNGGDGTVTMIAAKGGDKYSVAGTLTTEKGARTMALDPKTHKLYLSSASYGAAPAPTAQTPKPRPAVLPDSFRILVFAQ